MKKLCIQFKQLKSKLTINYSIEGHSNGRADNCHWTNRNSLDQELKYHIESDRKFKIPNSAKELVAFLNKTNSNPKGAFNKFNPKKVKYRKYVELTPDMIQVFKSSKVQKFQDKNGSILNEMSGISSSYKFNSNKKEINCYLSSESKKSFMKFVAL